MTNVLALKVVGIVIFFLTVLVVGPLPLYNKYFDPSSSAGFPHGSSSSPTRIQAISTRICSWSNSMAGGLFVTLGLVHLLPEAAELFNEHYDEETVGKYHPAFAVCFAAYTLLLLIQRVIFSGYEGHSHGEEDGHHHQHHAPADRDATRMDLVLEHRRSSSQGSPPLLADPTTTTTTTTTAQRDQKEKPTSCATMTTTTVKDGRSYGAFEGNPHTTKEVRGDEQGKEHVPRGSSGGGPRRPPSSCSRHSNRHFTQEGEFNRLDGTQQEPNNEDGCGGGASNNGPTRRVSERRSDVFVRIALAGTTSSPLITDDDNNGPVVKAREEEHRNGTEETLLLYSKESAAMEEHGGVHHPHTHLNATKVVTSIVLVLAFSIHGLGEGIALGVQTDPDGVLLMLIAIILHKWAEALSIGVSFQKSGLPKRQCLIYLGAFSCSAPLGIAIGWASSALLPETVSAFLMAFSTGTFLYLGASDVLVEEFSHGGRNAVKFLFYLLGAAIIFIVTIFFDHDHAPGGDAEPVNFTVRR